MRREGVGGRSKHGADAMVALSVFIKIVDVEGE